MFDVPVLVDFFSCLALLSLLAGSYRFVHRNLGSRALTQVCLGFMFGAITYLQMNAPLEISEGLIVDLRHVPVILAGAFLGWRGAIPCLAIAIAARVSVGGVGMEPGVVGLVLATVIGFAWFEVMRNKERRGVFALVVLALAGSARLVALLLLPPQMASFFMVSIFPVLLPLEVVSIVLIGLLLEREGAMISDEKKLRASANTDPGSGLLTLSGLERAYDNVLADNATTGGTGLVLVRLRNAKWIRRQYGSETLDQVRGALRYRIERDLPRSDMLGLTTTGDIAVLLNDRSAHSHQSIAEGVQRGACRRSVRLSDGTELRITIDTGHIWDPKRLPLAQLIKEASSVLSIPKDVAIRRADGILPGEKASDALFSRANSMMGQPDI